MVTGIRVDWRVKNEPTEAKQHLSAVNRVRNKTKQQQETH